MVLNEWSPPAAVVDVEETTTARLSLRAPRDADLDLLVQLHNDPAVTRFCACMTPQGRLATEEQFQSWLAHWKREGFGHWAITTHDKPEQPIGFGGLMRRSVGGQSGLYLYYRIAPQAWGRGYAAEMLLQALSLAFDQLHESTVYAAVLPANMPTRKTLEQIGLRLQGSLADTPGRAASLLYEASVNRWAGMPAQQPQAIAFTA